MLARVKDEPDLVRTPTGAIQNTNVDEYRSFIAKRKAALDTTARIDSLERENKEINQKLDMILKLLTKE